MAGHTDGNTQYPSAQSARASPVLRPVAPIIDLAHGLVGESLPPSPDHALGRIKGHARSPNHANQGTRMNVIVFASARAVRQKQAEPRTCGAREPAVAPLHADRCRSAGLDLSWHKLRGTAERSCAAASAHQGNRRPGTRRRGGMGFVDTPPNMSGAVTDRSARRRWGDPGAARGVRSCRRQETSFRPYRRSRSPLVINAVPSAPRQPRSPVVRARSAAGPDVPVPQIHIARSIRCRSIRRSAKRI